MFDVEPKPLETTISAASQISGSSEEPDPPLPSGWDAPSAVSYTHLTLPTKA